MGTKVYKARVGSWVWSYLQSGWLEEYPAPLRAIVERIDISQGRFYTYLPATPPEHWKDLTRGGVFPKYKHAEGAWTLDTAPQQRLIRDLQKWLQEGNRRGLQRLLWGVHPFWQEGDSFVTLPPSNCTVNGRLIEWLDDSCPIEWVESLVLDLDVFYPPTLIVGHNHCSVQKVVEYMQGKDSLGDVALLVVGVHDGESYLIWQRYSSERFSSAD